MSADFKIDKNMQEMRDLLKALEIENRSPLDLAILVSLLCVDLLVSRDTISLKMVPGETRSNENVLSLSKVSLIICMLGWFLYFWIAFSLIFMVTSLTTLPKKCSVFQQSQCQRRLCYCCQLALYFHSQSLFRRKAV